jgi:hypothetical protein
MRTPLVRVFVPDANDHESQKAFFFSIKKYMSTYAGEDWLIIRPIQPNCAGTYTIPGDDHCVRVEPPLPGMSSDSDFFVHSFYIDEKSNAGFTSLARDLSRDGRNLRFKLGQCFHIKLLNFLASIEPCSSHVKPTSLKLKIPRKKSKKHQNRIRAELVNIAEAKSTKIIHLGNVPLFSDERGLPNDFHRAVASLFEFGIPISIITKCKFFKTLLANLVIAETKTPVDPVKINQAKSAIFDEVDTYSSRGFCRADWAWGAAKTQIEINNKRESIIDKNVIETGAAGDTFGDLMSSSADIPVQNTYSWYGYIVWNHWLDIEAKTQITVCRNAECGALLMKRDGSKGYCTMRLNPSGYKTCQKYRNRIRKQESRRNNLTKK